MYCRHSTGNFIITHKDEGGGKNRKKLTGQTSTMTASQDLDWSAAADKDEKYAIYSYVQQSKSLPIFLQGKSIKISPVMILYNVLK